MRPDDAEDGDTLESHLDQTSAATISKLLREALAIRFDDLIEFEDGSLAGYDDKFRLMMAKKMRRNNNMEPWHA